MPSAEAAAQAETLPYGWLSWPWGREYTIRSASTLYLTTPLRSRAEHHLPGRWSAQQEYISGEIVPKLEPYFDKARDMLPQPLADKVNSLLKANAEALRPGLELAKKGYKPKYPVIIVPGFVTSGLVLWQGKPCAQKYFRCHAYCPCACCCSLSHLNLRTAEHVPLPAHCTAVD